MKNSIENRIKTKVSLAPFTTFKIGGQADFFIEVKKKEDLIESIIWAKKKKLFFFIIAGGSNVLVSDDGYQGLVIKYSGEEIKINKTKLICSAGTKLAEIIKQAKKFDLSGIEWASRIPGTVGGAVRGNAGAFGGEIKQTIETVEVFDVENEKQIILDNCECQFGYRDSIFKHNSNLIILNVVINLFHRSRKETERLTKQYNEHRLQSLPVEPSAGCIFKNIKLSELERNNKDLAKKVKSSIQTGGGEIGAGWFIEQLGLKGKIIGGAQISSQHANFVINKDKATAKDVVMLISLIKQKIRTKFKIQLQEEIQYLGF